MHTVIRQPAGRHAADMESVLARMLDVMLIALGAVLASLRFAPDTGHSILEVAFVAFDMVFAVLLLPWFGVYDSWRGRSKLRLGVNLVLGWVVVQVCGLAMMYLVHDAASVSRLWFASWTAITAAGLVASRLMVHAALQRMRRAGRNLRTVAVVGAGAHRDSVIANIVASPGAGFRAVAAFNTRPEREPDAPGLPGFRRLREFAGWVRREEIDEVWLALPMSEEDTVLTIMDEFSGDLVNLRFIPDVRSLVMFDRNVIDLIGAPAINLMASPMTPYALMQKAAFDRVFAAVALLALSPVMLAIALTVKATSKGPVLFTQRRKGVDGRVFSIYKFRSMRAHAELPGVVRQATRGDPRITRVGAFLRRTSLDELPQFMNVLRGEMSVVGPRPHAIEHDDQYRSIVDGYIHRYRIKPGITGWAQVNGFRGETDKVEKMQARVEHDLYYLRNWSFGLDMRIVLATVMKGLRHRNAY
ncbi:undecaprenyl-phosphate glucose phosphotransferase [Paraburkholderia ginsengiterrae]|uniref:Undecaprenyl-phosphate glucose phosphotransferase n=1 Tax=Paraburkholderia ginsengiterrae TaxID=1462993 RepID=A0A1A9N477_9BURK|nr:undecaprenyl-phosphate glucose phosphotransferase [Paraburkholderia ginsengiterrae]OAJ53138.1 undecaprenyl-phosphate glucose phosphotransferase [Paraburkholderia ginsengiterrae]OAJ55837.1 undecaprenyl-phosphate glucose phosphotransferase [Paraburkholderia ginsengiterrae]